MYLEFFSGMKKTFQEVKQDLVTKRVVSLSLTFSDESNFPARASKRVVFPDEGGPNKSAIL